MSTIELTNCGPVAHLSFVVPEDGGLVVLRGRNGRGKTKTLEAIENAMTGRGRIEVTDGQLRGEVEAFGVNIKVGRSTRRSGELEVTSLEGRLSVAELVDPGIKSAEAADARRIKALVQLSGTKPSPELFYQIVGGREQFEALVSKPAAESDDLVVMADRVKRDLEAAARKEESQAEHADGRARGARDSAAGVDLAQESDGAALQGQLEAAIRHESALKAQAVAHTRAAMLAGQARAKLEDAEAAYSGPTSQAATATVLQATAEAEEATTAMRAAERALQLAQSRHDQAKAELDRAVKSKRLADQHEALVNEFRQQLDAAIPESPSPEAVTEAAAQVQASREAVERGALIRQARQRLEEADALAAEAEAHRSRADNLREAAKGTDEVLSTVVAKSGSPLRVEAGRLVLDTRRGATYFADLSHGERWRIALDIAIDALGDRGVMVIPQEAFESLDPPNRLAIAEHVRGRGVVILTAEATDDEEIVAEVFGE